MSNRSVTANRSKFHIKLLADKSVVLVEVHGYESEIFLPEVQSGRIYLTNVLCDRQPKNPATDVRSNSPLHRCTRLPNRKPTTGTAGLAAKKLVSVGPKLRFELKLISDGNVVLVECNGYESEIFLPHITSHCVVMKRVCADELAQYAIGKSKRSLIKPLATTDNAAFIAASLAAQAVGLSTLLVNPTKFVREERNKRSDQKSQTVQKARRKLNKQTEKLILVEQKKRHIKHQSKAAGDA